MTPATTGTGPLAGRAPAPCRVTTALARTRALLDQPAPDPIPGQLHLEHPMALHLVPVRFRDAAGFVAMWHRHHQPPPGALFCVGAADTDGVLRAVAIVGRPVARHLDDGQTAEVTRTATDGTANANSMLYGAAWRAARALGYTRLITYTQHGESGASLRGAGWRVVAQRPARRGWDCPARPRNSHGADHIPRTLWEAA